VKIRAGETLIHINIFIFIVPVILFAAGYLEEYAAAFLSICLHETGHIIAARIYGCRPDTVKLLPVGLSVSINDRGCNGKGLLVIYSAGPCINLLILAAAYAASVSQGAGGFWGMVASINAAFALFNLIPVYPLDGGRILLELLSGKIGLLAAGRFARRLSLALALAILCLGVYQLLASAHNFSLIMIGLYVIVLWKNSKMESALMNIRQILYRQSRLKKKGIYPARELVAIKHIRLEDMLQCMDFDRFHLVHVLDDDLRLLRVFTEAEILDAVVAGEKRTFGELLEAGKDSVPGTGNAQDGKQANIDL
jgi:stage IV sporulation protein FB